MADPVQSLQSEASCAICLDYFKDPVITQCGHNFCQACLTKCWQGLEEDFPCPQCRAVSPQGLTVPNRQMRNVVDIARRLSQKRKRREEDLCPRHEEELKFFCKEDHEPVCLVCNRSRNHAGHTVIPIEEAALDHKGILQNWLPPLKEDLEDVLEYETKEEKKYVDMKAAFKVQRNIILSLFEEIERFVERKKQDCLSNLGNQEDETLSRIYDTVTELEVQQTTISNLITEIERKCQQQQQHVELLKGQGWRKFPQANQEDQHFQDFPSQDSHLNNNGGITEVTKIYRPQ